MNHIYDFISNNTFLYGVEVYIRRYLSHRLEFSMHTVVYQTPKYFGSLFIHNVRRS